MLLTYLTKSKVNTLQADSEACFKKARPSLFLTSQELQIQSIVRTRGKEKSLKAVDLAVTINYPNQTQMLFFAPKCSIAVYELLILSGPDNVTTVGQYW